MPDIPRCECQPVKFAEIIGVPKEIIDTAIAQCHTRQEQNVPTTKLGKIAQKIVGQTVECDPMSELNGATMDHLGVEQCDDYTHSIG